MSIAALQSSEELDIFYEVPDPWGYDETPDDALRVEMMQAHLPRRHYARVLDIGCGNGFLTSRLPGEEIHGADISAKALSWARQRCPEPRFHFHQVGVLELEPERLGTFDLIVMTGVAYPQYIGSAMSLAGLRIDALLREGGIFAHTHITDWFSGGFSYPLIDRHLYRYRDRWHLLETYIK